MVKQLNSPPTKMGSTYSNTNNTNNNNSNSGGMNLNLNLTSTLRVALILTMFVVVIIQLHLSLDKFYSQSAPCPYESPLVVLNNASIAAQAQTELGLRSRTRQLPGNQVQQFTPSSQQPIPSPLEQSSGSGKRQPGSKLLPEINHNGMIIFYLHIPKTGGTTIMQPFESNPHWRYRMVYGWNKQNKYRQEMYHTLENWTPGMKIFYEYHAGLSSPYMELRVREDLLKWRAMAQVRKIPFFAFTVIREPLSFAVSHFNYYYASRKKGDTRYFFVPDPTEDDFVRLSLPNPQCLFCVHTEEAYYQNYREQGRPIHVSKEGCEAVYESFETELDWVGTTEALSTETFPLIQHVANVKFEKEEVKNKSHDKIKKSKLKPETVNYIRNLTQFDQNMYDRAQADFPISMWSNFDPDLPRPQPHKHVNLHMKKFDTPDLLGHEAKKREREEKLLKKKREKNRQDQEHEEEERQDREQREEVEEQKQQ